MDDPVTWLRAQIGADEQRDIQLHAHGRIPPPLFDQLAAEQRVKLLLIAYHDRDNQYECCAYCSEVTAGGKVVGDWPCPTLRLLFLPYAGRPGCRREWLPEV